VKQLGCGDGTSGLGLTSNNLPEVAEEGVKLARVLQWDFGGRALETSREIEPVCARDARRGDGNDSLDDGNEKGVTNSIWVVSMMAPAP